MADKIVNRLAKMCSAWGGQLMVLPKQDFRRIRWAEWAGLSRSPVSYLGVDWRSKKVFTAEPGAWHHIIHEMGHVFACKDIPKVSQEIEFLGWEHAVARQVASSDAWFSSWESCSEGYVLTNDGRMFGDVPRRESVKIIADLEKRARKKKIVDAAGRPLAIR